MKSKKIFPLIGITLIILFFIFGTPRYQSVKISNESFIVLENKLKEASNTNSEININNLTSFSWDECYVFPPYYPQEMIYEKVGREWTSSETFIEFLMFHNIENQTVNDDQYLIVFKKDNNIVLSKIYDLDQLPVIFKLDKYKFKSNNANFLIKVSNQYDEGKIKELTLKD
ncbi:hypothetical protein OSC52_01150 [Clostridium pasteurianum]|uniref:hypothetical protein n=1 Tax=Clostridium pasteurianum TaxID=1501 RepID=UPI002260BF35|nr:hypothetical protein [Clostridium pasteurianum]UZW14480.1 hypothetical protein OSC52_01150 [Clostridium pasteurianum]